MKNKILIIIITFNFLSFSASAITKPPFDNISVSKNPVQYKEIIFEDFDGKPINLKSSSLVANYPGPKYKKVSFSNPGHAENLVKKLNAQHQTDKFAVYLLKSGTKFSR